MIKVAFVAGTYQPHRCGVAHYTAHLRHKLKERQIDSIVFTTHEAAIQMPKVEPDNLTVIGAIDRWHVTRLPKLVQAIHQSHADLLHIQHAAGTYHFDRAIFLLPFILRLTGWTKPIVTTIHEYGWWEWQPKFIPFSFLEWLKVWGQKLRWWDREDGFLLTQSDIIITTNSEAQNLIATRLPHLKSILHRIPIGANVTVAPTDRHQARQAIRDQYNWPSDVAIVAFFGFLHPVKGLPTLFAAFQQVLQNCPHIRLLLIGGVESLALPAQAATQYWEQLKIQLTQQGLENAVYMTGYLEPTVVSQHLVASDIGVLPFNHGVTLKSGSLLTMMSHALPIITTHATPPDPELDRANVTRSITPRNISQLTSAFLELLQDKTLRQQLGQASYEYSRQFTWNNIADEHVHHYQQLINPKNTNN